MRKARFAAVGAAVLLLGAMSAFAQEAEKTDKELVIEAARAWVKYREARKTCEAAVDTEKRATRKQVKAFEKATNVFVKAFRKPPLAIWDVKRQQSDLIADGHVELGRTALAEGDAAVAVEAFERFLTKLPEHERAERVRVFRLPAALFSLADADRAVARIEELFPDVPGLRKRHLAEALAKVHAANGNYFASFKAYNRAIHFLRDYPEPERKRTSGPLKGTSIDDNRVEQSRLMMESVAIGRPRSLKGVTKVVGGTEGAVKHTPGKVLLLDFFDLSSGMPEWNAGRLQFVLSTIDRPKVRVAGVTWFSARIGKLLPTVLSNAGDAGGPVVVDPETFPELLERWRRVAKVRHPVAIVQRPDSRDLLTGAYQGLHVFDTEGRLAYRGGYLLDHVEATAAIRTILARKKEQVPEKK